MACYKNETKHKCSKVVMVISIVAVVMGLLTAIFGLMKSGKADDYLNDAKEAAGQEKSEMSVSKDLGIEQDGTIGAIIIVGGIVTIITGVLGLLTVKFKKPYFAVPFVAMSFMVALLLLIGAAISLAGSASIVKEGCDFMAKDKNGPGMSPAKMYTELVETNMCSEVCPCDDAHKALFDNLDADQKKSLGREQTDLVFKPKDDGGIYTDFKTCYDAQKGEMKTLDGMEQKAKDWIESKGSQALTLLEEQFFKDDGEGCASMCETPVFHWSSSIAKGPAKQDCLTAVVNEVSEGTAPAGAVALLSGLALIVAGIGGFPLCQGFNDKKDEPPQ